MKSYLVTLLVVVAGLSAAAIALSCSTDPCEDLQSYAEACDGEVRARGLQVVEAADQDQCRLYRDSWYVTWQPRCGFDGGAGGDDAGGGLFSDAGMADAGDADTGGDL